MSKTKLAAPAILAALFATAFHSVPAVAAKKTYCCNDREGRRVCADYLPKQCEGLAYRMIDEKGIAREVEAPLTEEQLARKEAEEARKAEEARIAAEKRRRDQALLNTYSTEADIDRARDRNIAELERAIKLTVEKQEQANKRKAELQKELEFYAKKPVPANLKAQIKDNDKAIAELAASVAEKRKGIDEVRAKFDDEKKRYRTLTQKSDDKANAGLAVPAAPAAPAKP